MLRGLAGALLLHSWGLVVGAKAGAGKASVPEWRLVWCWSDPEEDPEAKIRKASELGFNAFVPALPGKERAHLAASRRHGVACYMPIYGDVRHARGRGAAQTMRPEEERRLEQQTRNPARRAMYQFGGEPLYPEEIYWNRMLCPNRSASFEAVRKQIDAALEAGFDGLAFDYFGYQNYRRCHCRVCDKMLEEYLSRAGVPPRHPGGDLGEEEAPARFGEQSLVDFINRAARYAREKNPRVRTTCHVYPHFAPNPFYGSRLELDYCGITTSWFFAPHWSFDKIEAYTRKVIEGRKARPGTSVGAPFIGVYARDPHAGHAKDAARVKRELEIAGRLGARGVQMAELGHILADGRVARVVSEFMHGM